MKLQVQVKANGYPAPPGVGWIGRPAHGWNGTVWFRVLAHDGEGGVHAYDLECKGIIPTDPRAYDGRSRK